MLFLSDRRILSTAFLFQSLLSSLIQKISPDNSIDNRPALPARFQKSTDSNGLGPFLCVRINTDLAGKLTPSSRVDVQNR